MEQHANNSLSRPAAQVYMDSIGDLLYEPDPTAGSGGSAVGSRPKLEVKNGPFGSHLPGLTEKQVMQCCLLSVAGVASA